MPNWFPESFHATIDVVDFKDNLHFMAVFYNRTRKFTAFFAFNNVDYVPFLPYVPENTTHEAVYRDFVYGIQYTQQIHGYTCRQFGPLDLGYGDVEIVDDVVELKSAENMLLETIGIVLINRRSIFKAPRELDYEKQEIIEVSINNGKLERIKHHFKNNKYHLKGFNIYDIYEDPLHGVNAVSINSSGLAFCGPSLVFRMKFNLTPDDFTLLKLNNFEHYIFENLADIVGISLLRITNIQEIFQPKHRELTFRFADTSFFNSTVTVNGKRNLNNEDFKKVMKEKIEAGGITLNIVTNEKTEHKVEIFSFEEDSESVDEAHPNLNSENHERTHV